MEIRMIEGKTFEKLKLCIIDLLAQLDTLHAEPDNGWLDNQAVCRILSISKRSLQTFRDKGLIPYSQIGHKCFYKQEDVKEFLERNRVEVLKKHE
ncbi:DNA-binding protein [Dysgonomonas sp. 521]|uniref:helix-turn-helix domain-containing protein n=1 Tax=Dysgonomonas sp. 521 TaxID=2302932 RepID=UPI0013D74713|nr:helix-turn-helix domain-containing protein [Dysgonomonas sp. 521]NDV94515.1 DNA-binding protein [Dysgonomonas sp. 521]